MATLRGPDGCPWDHEQTLETLRRYLVEETYEVLDALDGGDPSAHCEELGDLLLQVVFQARIREEQGHFDVASVATTIAEKLVRRHPHVFGDAQVSSAAEVVRNWAEIKAAEKPRDSALDGVPRTLPALQRAQRIGEKAASAGFDWRRTEDVLAKLDEERAELEAALVQGRLEEVERELGDYLFTVVNAARRLGVDAESALRGTVSRFETRFRRLEGELRSEGRRVNETDDAELEARWQNVKRALASGPGDPNRNA
jgi:MazG family protein